MTNDTSECCDNVLPLLVWLGCPIETASSIALAPTVSGNRHPQSDATRITKVKNETTDDE